MERAAVSWRGALRTLGERGLIATGVPSVSRASMRDDALVLAYHNIVPDGAQPCGDRSLHLPQRSFAEQLDWLLDGYDVVPLDRVLPSDAPRARRPRVAITFDDAYRGAVTVGVRELVRRGLPATIFVTPAFVGGKTFWWDALTPRDADGLDATFRARALDEFQGDDARVRAWSRANGSAEQPAPDHAVCASEDELCAAARQPGITLGSHTWSHRNLVRLDDAELGDELGRPLAWLEERFGTVSHWISYPYGSYDARVAQGARRAGYSAGLRIDGGWVRGAARDPFAVPRLNVPAGLSIDGFILRTSGLLCR